MSLLSRAVVYETNEEISKWRNGRRAALRMLWEKSRVGSSPTFETIRVNRNYYYSSGRKESSLSAGPDPCGIDEIGRHSGLRIRGFVRMGSSPLFRTKLAGVAQW